MPDRRSRRYLLLPCGIWIPLERCDESVWITATRIEASSWIDQFPIVGEECKLGQDWALTTIADKRRHSHLHTALTRMSGTPNTGGLLTNLRRARETSTLYGINGSFEVALCHRDPAFEGGSGRFLEVAKKFSKGMITMPPAIARLLEMENSWPQLDIVVLPPSPLLSNVLRLQLAAPVLIRRTTLESLRPRLG